MSAISSAAALRLKSYELIDRVGSDFSVDSDEREFMLHRLSNQESVKGIAVECGKARQMTHRGFIHR